MIDVAIDVGPIHPRISIAMAATIVAGLLSALPADAQPRYWGKEEGAATGWIELGHEKYHEVGVGTEIPAWGRIKAVTDDRVVLEIVRTESDKQAVHERGGLAYDILEIHVLREDLR